jgi:RNA polymerase sigma-70 factor, ECF subfamily
VIDDAELAAAFAAHADGALEEAYRRYGSLLRAAARHVLGADGDAHDCVHDALIRIWSRGIYRTERGALPAFLVVCVRNEAISRRRSATRQVALERRVASENVDDGFDPAERITIRTALATLPREQRNVIELAYWGRYTQAEIADRLAVPLGTIKSRASMGLRKLARTLGPQG